MELNGKQRALLGAFAQLGNVRAAALAARVARRSHYYWLTESHYAALFRDAREEAVDNLAAEVRRRAVECVQVPVFYQGQMCYQKEFDPQTGQM